MSYAIIGFGKIGQALARAFARRGIEVSVATTRDPDSFSADAARIGPTIRPKTLAEAVKADVVFLAVRFDAHRDVARALPDWNGKTVIDAMTERACNLLASLDDRGDMGLWKVMAGALRRL